MTFSFLIVFALVLPTPGPAFVSCRSKASSQTLSKKEPSDSSQARTWTVNMVFVPKMTVHHRLYCSQGLCGTLVTRHIATEFILEWDFQHLYYSSSVTLSFYYAVCKYRFSYWFYRESYTEGFLLWLSCYLWISSDLIRSFLCFHLLHHSSETQNMSGTGTKAFKKPLQTQSKQLDNPPAQSFIKTSSLDQILK